jgi:hypothetical protein
MENKVEHQDEHIKKTTEVQASALGITASTGIFRMLNSDPADIPVKPQMVMQLQRTVGNQATQQVLQRKKKKRREGLGSHAETIRKILMTQADWQKKTSSLFNKRGSHSSEILLIDDELGLIDEALAANPPELRVLKTEVRKIQNNINSWIQNYTDTEEAKKSVRYAAFKELSEQALHIIPIINSWVALLDSSPDEMNKQMNTGVTHRIRQDMEKRIEETPDD